MQNENAIRLINLPSGEDITYDEYTKRLEDDNIFIPKTNPKVDKVVNSYYRSSLHRQILGSRYDNPKDIELYLNTKLNDILHMKFIEANLPDVIPATELIHSAISNNKLIVNICDIDCDGLTSGALFHKMMKGVLEYNNFKIVHSTREKGYGVNQSIVDEIASLHQTTPIGLVITSDLGSADRESLTKIRDLGIEIITTDHHLIPSAASPEALGPFVNPKRGVKLKELYTEHFYDITGAAVLYFLLTYTFRKYYFDRIKEDYLYYLISYVGLTIVSDMVSLQSFVNRKLLIKALLIINNDDVPHDIFWFNTRTAYTDAYIDETILGFDIIPPINATNRLGSPNLGFSYLIAEKDKDYSRLHETIQELNGKRKDLQKRLLDDTSATTYEDGEICIMYVEESDGIQGILASNMLNDHNYKICIVFSKSEDGIYVGSGRSDTDIHLKNLIDMVKYDDILKHGGHAAAIGMKFKGDLKEFYLKLKHKIKMLDMKMDQKHYIDNIIYGSRMLILSTLDILETAPYGMEFSQPVLYSQFYIDSYRAFGKHGEYISMKVKLRQQDKALFYVFYRAKAIEREQLLEDIKEHKIFECQYTLNISVYKQTKKILIRPLGLKFIKGKTDVND